MSAEALTTMVIPIVSALIALASAIYARVQARQAKKQVALLAGQENDRIATQATKVRIDSWRTTSTTRQAHDVTLSHGAIGDAIANILVTQLNPPFFHVRRGART